jgi:sterol desaturase/sphingolipid hydroxylase (fatty acid hydroxylase superfamily)
LSGYVPISMTWDVIKQVLLPAGEGSVTLTLVYWSVLTAFAGFEFFAPQFAKQQRAQRWPANFGLGLINMALLPLAPISGFLAAGWAERNGIGVLNWLEVWWPFAAIATMAIQSLAAYATHRLFHSSSWFWRVHRVHHFDTAVDVSTGLRHHPLEIALTLLIDSLVAIIFGLVPLVLMIYGFIELMFALFSHANITLPNKMDQMLRVFFVTPRIHVIHHSSYQPETDSNYGTVLTIWDRLFGTYSDLRAECPEAIQFGLSELQDDRADDLWWQLKSPAIDSNSGNIRHPVSQK